MKVIARLAREAFFAEASKLGSSDPLAGAVLLAREQLGEPADPSPLFEFWSTRSPGHPAGEMRYRWELSHRHGARLPAFAGDPIGWQAFRPKEQFLVEKDPYLFEEQLVLPVILVDNLELLSRSRETQLGGVLLAEAEPVLRRDFALCVQALHPFRDTFALSYLARRPRALASMHPLAVAIATCYAASARVDGAVLGLKFPFARKPLVAATAQLAAGLLCLGLEIDIVANLIDHVRGRQLENGGFGDDGDDVLTTVAAADLLSTTDPSFDPSSVHPYLASRASPDGLFRVLGPEALWLTADVLGWYERSQRPFAERFRFPFLPAHNRDQKTGLPFFAYFADLATLFSALPGLSREDVDVAFIDLAGFRAFNNAYGQDRGDDVLRVFGRALTTVPFVCPVRDGGDEFLLIGAPGRGGLDAEMVRFRARWPGIFRDAFGPEVPPVAPRILTARARGAGLWAARELLGKSITKLKQCDAPGAEGTQRDLGAI